MLEGSSPHVSGAAGRRVVKSRETMSENVQTVETGRGDVQSVAACVCNAIRLTAVVVVVRG